MTEIITEDPENCCVDDLEVTVIIENIESKTETDYKFTMPPYFSLLDICEHIYASKIEPISKEYQQYYKLKIILSEECREWLNPKTTLNTLSIPTPFKFVLSTERIGIRYTKVEKNDPPIHLRDSPVIQNLRESPPIYFNLPTPEQLSNPFEYKNSSQTLFQSLGDSPNVTNSNQTETVNQDNYNNINLVKQGIQYKQNQNIQKTRKNNTLFDSFGSNSSRDNIVYENIPAQILEDPRFEKEPMIDKDISVIASFDDSLEVPKRKSWEPFSFKHSMEFPRVILDELPEESLEIQLLKKDTKKLKTLLKKLSPSQFQVYDNKGIHSLSSPFFLGLQLGNKDALKLIIQKYIDLRLDFSKFKDSRGNSLLHLMFITGKPENILSVLKHKAFENALTTLNKNGQNLLHCFALYYPSTEKIPSILEILLSAKLNPNLIDNHGETPLFKCFNNKNREAAITICSHLTKERNLDLTVINNYSQTVLDLARKSGFSSLFSKLDSSEKSHKPTLKNIFKKSQNSFEKLVPKPKHSKGSELSTSTPIISSAELKTNRNSLNEPKKIFNQNLIELPSSKKREISPPTLKHFQKSGSEISESPRHRSISISDTHSKDIDGHWNDITREQAEQILIREYRENKLECFLTRNSSLQEHFALSLLREKTLTHLRITKTLNGWQLQNDYSQEYFSVNQLCETSPTLKPYHWLKKPSN